MYFYVFQIINTQRYRSLSEIGNFAYNDVRSTPSSAQFYQFPSKYRKHFNFGLNKNKNKQNSLLPSGMTDKLSFKSSILGFSPKLLALDKHKRTETLSSENFMYKNKNMNNVSRYLQNSENSSLTPTSFEYAQNKYKLADNYSFNNSRSVEKLVDNKRYSMQESDWAPNATSAFVRRHSQRGSFKSQRAFVSPQELLHKHRFADGQNVCAGLQTPPNRRRSMSFSECCDLESPSLSEAHSERLQGSLIASGENKPNNSTVFGQLRLRNSIACKPKSKRARNLRRLSYNPIIIDSSSSSSSETDCDHRNVAQSEYDIRTKVSMGHRYRNTEIPPFRRRTHSSATNKVNHSDTNSLYGSNSSIKSAPQYNYSCDGLRKNSEKQLNYPIYDPNYQSSNINNSLFDGNSNSTRQRFQNTCQLLSSLSRITDETAMTPELLNNFYTQLEIKKLSHKNSIQSLSTEVLSENLSDLKKSENGKYDGKITLKEPSSIRTNHKATALNSTNSENFQWPEKIHVPAGLSKNLKWLQKTAAVAMPAQSQAQSIRTIQSSNNGFSNNDSSSSTETDFCSEEYNSQMPPSPAP